MSTRFLSDDWYRVAGLRPRLLAQVSITRQRFRGKAWYVLLDQASGRSHRFTPATYALIDGMDGTRTVDELWNTLADTLGDHAPTQDEVIQLLYQLHAADVLQIDALPELGEAIERRRRQLRAKWLQAIGNPMALRFPLWDPQRFIDRSWPYVRWAFGPVGLLLWLAVVGSALLQLPQHWAELSSNVADRVLALENLVWLWLSYPVVKFCHEMGHAWAIRRGDGEVHEMGLMFLVFAPVPYVDASASNAFRDKWARIGVAAAGILVELFLAALALFVWIVVEPGAIRAIAFNVMLIGGVSTIVFNANPLLRFDGYYMLADFLEIPNLAQRSNRYLGYLVKRHVFGAEQAQSPGYQRGERVWMLLYAPVAWCYRLFVMFGIALFVAGKYFFVGVILALWTVGMMLLWPAAKGLAFVLRDAELDRHRRRALAVTLASCAVVVLFTLFVPLPYWTSAEGVVWVPPNAEVRAGSGGFVARLRAGPGDAVATGDTLLALEDADLAAELAVRRARVEQLGVRYAQQRFDDRLQSELTRQELEAERAALAHSERRVADLVARAGRDGFWVLPDARDVPGRYFAQGALLGYVVAGALDSVRVVVRQEDADQVRQDTQRVRVRLVDRPHERFEASVTREVPGGAQELPAKSMTIDGGGLFATDPRDPSGLKTLARTFQFDLKLATAHEDLRFGTRAHVRFEHRPATLATQLYRRVRQVLLSRLGV